MKNSMLIVVLLLVAIGSSGCSTTGHCNPFNPEPVALQRARAERYDPYPEVDIGPDMTGVRPRDFDQPSAEPQRARWIWDEYRLRTYGY